MKFLQHFLLSFLWCGFFITSTLFWSNADLYVEDQNSENQHNKNQHSEDQSESLELDLSELDFSDMSPESSEVLERAIQNTIRKFTEKLTLISNQLDTIDNILHKKEEFLDQKKSEYYESLGPKVLSAFKKREAAYKAWEKQIEKDNPDMKVIQLFDEELSYRESILEIEIRKKSFNRSSQSLDIQVNLDEVIAELDQLNNRWKAIFQQKENIETKISGLKAMLKLIRMQYMEYLQSLSKTHI